MRKAADQDRTLAFYHGGREWFGDFEVNPKNSKVMEHGPGLYLTNGIETARHYAKGGGVVQLIGIDPNATRISDSSVSIEDMVAFVRQHSIRHGKLVIEDLHHKAERMESDHLCLDYLVNLMINHKSLTPSAAKPLNEFIVSQGVDLDVFDAPMFCSHGGKQDQWLVIFNPKVVIEKSKVDMKSFDWSETHLPRYEAQLASVRSEIGDALDPLATSANEQRKAGLTP